MTDSGNKTPSVAAAKVAAGAEEFATPTCRIREVPPPLQILSAKSLQHNVSEKSRPLDELLVVSPLSCANFSYTTLFVRGIFTLQEWTMNVEKTNFPTSNEIFSPNTGPFVKPKRAVPAKHLDVDFLENQPSSSTNPPIVVSSHQNFFVKMLDNFVFNVRSINKKLSSMDKCRVAGSGIAVCLGANFGAIVAGQIILQIALMFFKKVY